MLKDNRVKWYIKKGVKCLAIVLILALAGYGVLLWDFYAVEAFVVADVPIVEGQITIMSSNVRNHNISDFGDKSWYVRAELQLEQITEVAPDIICFQEVKATQEYYFNQKLQGYDAVVVYRDSSLTAEATPIYYRTDKYNLVESGAFWFSETPEVSSTSWGSSFPRICTYVVLEELSTGSTFAVFNSHLDHKSEEARLNSIQMVVDKIAELGDIPAIFMGDFNGSESSSVYSEATNYFIDAKYQAAETMSSPSFNGFGTVAADDMAWLLDYCFYTENDFTALSYQILNTTANGTYRSDHYPLVCTLQIK